LAVTKPQTDTHVSKEFSELLQSTEISASDGEILNAMDAPDYSLDKVGNFFRDPLKKFPLRV